MGDFEHKILSMLTEATATDDFPASFSKDVSQADNPKANSVDKKWPVEGKVEDDSVDVVAEDDKADDDVDDEPTDVVTESDDDDDDDVVDADDDDVDFDDDDDDEEDDDDDKTFSEMIARLREAPDDPEKPEGEISEDQDGEVGKTEPKEEPFQESKKSKVKESKKTTAKGVKESKAKKTVAEGEVPDAFKKNWEKGDDKEDVKEGEMPDFLKKKLDKDGDGEPDVKEATLVVKEADGDDDDVKKDTDAMFGGEDLPESFRKKASLVFEAAVKSRAAEARKRYAEEATTKLKEAYEVLKRKSEARIATTEKKLSEQVDQYLTYVAGQWMKENRLAVEAGLRMELAEDFINGLKKLFVEHYIEVPQSKVDVVKLMGKKLSKMEARVNEQTKENVKLRESINRYRREEAVRVASKGLTETQADKLRKVSEGITFTSREQFASALTTLKESYFPKEKPKGTLVEEDAKKPAQAPAAPAAEPLNEEIDVYVKALSKKR